MHTYFLEPRRRRNSLISTCKSRDTIPIFGNRSDVWELQKWGYLSLIFDSPLSPDSAPCKLENYAKENKLEINTEKTQTMIMNKTGRLMRRPFYINGKLLQSVRTYKYLGFQITPSGELGTGLKDLKDRALRAYLKIKSDMGHSFMQDVHTSLQLIDFLVKPIMTYNSDFWGCMKLPKNDPQNQTRMQRSI